MFPYSLLDMSDKTTDKVIRHYSKFVIDFPRLLFFLVVFGLPTTLAVILPRDTCPVLFHLLLPRTSHICLHSCLELQVPFLLCNEEGDCLRQRQHISAAAFNGDGEPRDMRKRESTRPCQLVNLWHCPTSGSLLPFITQIKCQNTFLHTSSYTRISK